jgi:hypothetical protein
MGERIFVGVAEPGGAFTAEYRQWGDGPVQMLPELRQLRQQVHGGDTAAMAAAIYHQQHQGGEPLEHGHILEPADPYMVLLYLIHVPADAVEVHTLSPAAGRRGMFRWKLYSRHRLTAGPDELFALDGTTIRCTRCNAADDVEFATSPSATGPGGEDAIIRCRNCESSEITDPSFTVRQQFAN